MIKILFSGGGTGGHIFPIISIVRELREISPQGDFQFSYFGPKDKFASEVLPHEGIKVKWILAGKIRRYWQGWAFFQNLFDIFIKIPLGILQSFFYLLFDTPDLVFSKGGFGSLPVLISAKIFSIPIFLHESDFSPGLANRLLGNLADQIFVSFPKTEYFSPQKTILVGNPIRKEILQGSRERAKKLFNLTLQKPVLLILGGSQGSERINDRILDILSEILKDFEVIHQSGEKNYKELKMSADLLIDKNLLAFYHPFPFLKEEELAQAYQAADIIVSRAGSGSIFEIAAIGKPSILIPLTEAAQDHQFKNAYVFAQMGAAIVIEERNFTPHFFLEKLKYLISYPQELKKMAQAAKEFAKIEAAKEIAQYISNYFKNYGR